VEEFKLRLDESNRAVAAASPIAECVKSLSSQPYETVARASCVFVPTY